MADAFVRLGGRVYEQTRISDLPDPISQPNLIATESGRTIRAEDAVVYCTNSPISRNLGVHVRQEATRTYMLGLRIPKGK